MSQQWHPFSWVVWTSLSCLLLWIEDVLWLASASKLSDILSQMISTSLSKTAFTLMFSFAEVSKNSKPASVENWMKKMCFKFYRRFRYCCKKNRQIMNIQYTYFNNKFFQELWSFYWPSSSRSSQHTSPIPTVT